jgi:putative transposase
MASLTLSQLFRQVRDSVSDPEDERFGDLDAHFADSITCLLEAMALSEVERRAGAKLRERSPSRVDHRNGYRRRMVQTAYQSVTIRIPRLRGSGFIPSFLEPCRRAVKRTEHWVERAYLSGIGRAEIVRLMEQVTGCRPSEGLLNRVQEQLDERSKAFKERPLEKPYAYLFLDAAWVKDIVGSYAGRICVLTAIGVTLDGTKEVLGFERVKQESESSWRGFLTRLVARGLCPSLLSLVISDAHKGLLGAVPEVLGDVAHQLCWAHRCRNIYEAVERCDRKEMVQALRRIYRAPHLTAARQALKELRGTYEDKYPNLVVKLEEDMRYLGAFFSCPEEHRRYLRTTNPIERTFLELRRRRFGCGAFASPLACDRVVSAVFILLNNLWANKNVWNRRPMPIRTAA